MLERDLYEAFGISNFTTEDYKGYKAIRHDGNLYIMVPANGLDKDDLLELKYMSDYLNFQQEDRLAMFMPTVKQELMATINQQVILLLKVPMSSQYRQESAGMRLASFHQRGSFLPNPPQRMSRMGEWKSLWEKRLDQLENFWSRKVQERPGNRFERVFHETFPYYLGLTENAIQYVADCLYEDQQGEAQVGTICHLRYKPALDESPFILPTELVYDHPSRDIAEWVRHHYLEEGLRHEKIVAFFNEYEQMMPLTKSGWRLLYGRLLFPIHYFECVEGYYIASSEEAAEAYAKRFFKLVESSDEYEQFLGSFYQMIGLPVDKLQIPKLEWLQNKSVKI